MRARLTRAFLAGVLGTIAINLMAYTAFPLAFGGVPLDLAAMVGSVLGENWIAGLIADFALGTLIVPASYVCLFHRFIPGRPPVRGMVWGFLVWMVAQAVVSPLAGGGFFSQSAGDIPAAVGSLIGMLLYGGLFGLVLEGPRHTRSRAGSLDTREVNEPVHVRRAS